MNKTVYLVVYVGEIFGVYYKAGDIKYNIFSTKRRAKKYINNKVKDLPSDGYRWGKREEERSKYLIFKKVIDDKVV